MQCCAFLLSRQSRTITPQTPWLRKIEAAARWAVDEGFTLLAHERIVPAEFGAWLYRRLGGNVEVVATDDDLAHADVLIPISIRKGGTMERLARSGNVLEPNLEILLPTPHSQLSALHSQLPTPHSHLWHYTRSCPGPWPGQTRDEWFGSLLENHPGAAHSGGDALDRILHERKIRACGKMIKGAHPVVCFSERSPDELLNLRRYKPALLRWDFEPFAIGIPKSLCPDIRPVVYSFQPTNNYLYQKHDPPKVDFMHEAEWRNLGDFHLPDEIFIYRGDNQPA